MDPHVLPPINASLNALAGTCLFLGWRAIKAKNITLHKKYMIAAMTSSALFLCSYITYHVLKKGMVTKYQGEGIDRIAYFFILATHTPLAALVVPFSILAVWFAFKNNIRAHVKITKWLLPTWLYVSVTGVLIYMMLYIF